MRHYGTIGGSVADVDRAQRKIIAGSAEVHVVVYEAGPCGYALYRHLAAKGIDCTAQANWSWFMFRARRTKPGATLPV